jgi:hypothetical protein
MKLKHIFAATLSLLMVTACNDDNTVGTLGNIELDKTYVSIPATGGDATVTVKAAGDWQFDKVFQVITKKDDGSKDTTYYNTPSWLKLDKESGSAGETKITLHADATNGGRDTQLEIVCNGQRQYLQVMQGDETPEEATVAQVLAGPDGKTFRVTGTVEDISNTTYGNWYLRDNTGRVTIYGTLDKEGKTKNFSSLGIENGDVVTIEGPKTTYGTTVELVDVTVIKHTKAMLKLVDVQSTAVPKEGGDFVVKVAFKGSSVNPAIPADAQSWLGVTNIKTIAGVPSKTVTNPADTALITFHCQANSGSARSADVPITSGSTTLTATVKQLGDVITATLAEFRAASVGTAEYRIKGVVTKVDAAKGNVWINDYTDPTGTVEIYKIKEMPAGLKVGDIVTAKGVRAQYKTTVEMGSNDNQPVIENVESAKTVGSLADVANLSDGDLVVVSGTITAINNTKYGNMKISDGTTELTIYGSYGYGATNNDRYNFVTNQGLAVGDKITLVGPKKLYNTTVELVNAYYVSHIKATSGAKRRR